MCAEASTVLRAVAAEVTRGFEPISYRGALVSTLLHATVYVYNKIKWDYKKMHR
jgi:hypothetical protein